jgi:hypothetical protein
MPVAARRTSTPLRTADRPVAVTAPNSTKRREARPSAGLLAEVMMTLRRRLRAGKKRRDEEMASRCDWWEEKRAADSYPATAAEHFG